MDMPNALPDWRLHSLQWHTLVTRGSAVSS